MKHLLDEETISRTIRRSKNPIAPLLSTGWYVRRPCACQRHSWQKQEPHPLPRTLDEALRLAQQGQTYTGWGVSGLMED